MFSKLFGKKKADKAQKEAEAQKEQEAREQMEQLMQPDHLGQQLLTLLEGEEAQLQADHSIYLPAYDLTIRPQVPELADYCATVNFYLDCPKWDRQLFESCASRGDCAGQAVALSMCGFLFGMFTGIQAMAQGKEKCRVETTFEGKPHRWTVYQSQLLGAGQPPEEDTEGTNYWSLVAPKLSDYLGDCKLSYIKIFAGAWSGDYAGECRINDLFVPELSEEIRKIATGWKVSGQWTEKLFFFLVQDDETCHPYPYTQPQITDKVRTALSVFDQLLEAENEDRRGAGYDRCLEELTREVGDPHMAAEMFSFLPEFCALWEFPALELSMQLSLSFDGQIYKYHLTQLSAFYLLMTALQQLIAADELPRKLFLKLVFASDVWQGVRSLQKKGEDVTQSPGPFHATCSFPDGYCPR